MFGRDKDASQFEQRFITWLTTSLSEHIPDSLQGFVFNLYEPAGRDGAKFGIELVGTKSFDNTNPDWACDEVWTPSDRGLDIPIEYSGISWEDCLPKMRVLVLSHLSSHNQTVQKLKRAKGIGLGFVDGDLEIIWVLPTSRTSEG